MLDFFSIFSKGGIVLWCFNGTVGDFASPINALIKNVVLQERSGDNSYHHGQLVLKYKFYNEFDLVFVVGYQNILQLSYVDKLLTDTQREFRDKYKNQLDQVDRGLFATFDFDEDFQAILQECENIGRTTKKEMRGFYDSNKAANLKMRRGVLELEPTKEPKKKSKKNKAEAEEKVNTPPASPMKQSPPSTPNGVPGSEASSLEDANITQEDEQDEDMKIEERRRMLLAGKLKGGPKFKKSGGMSKNSSVTDIKTSPQAISTKKRGKEARSWGNGGTKEDAANLDYSNDKIAESASNAQTGETAELTEEDRAMIGMMSGDLKPVKYEEKKQEERRGSNQSRRSSEANAGGGVWGFFKGLAGQKAITEETLAPMLNTMREHLCSKNVAINICEKLCKSVETKLVGRVLGTFTGVQTAVKSSMHESLVQILSPKRRIDILRDVMEKKKSGVPYTIVFCGVNGVGKSTNLAKICFWLLENNFRVMIAACDTFRSGAVEQLRTHTKRLMAMSKTKTADNDKILLYDKGYGKDAASVALEARNLAKELKYDVCLIDTAGRMQDNEPLMRSLSKLIKINEPDLVLFVGEALVGNDGVDQLRKFNQALADHSDASNPHLIDGIVLTKFDTIDDKVGAAISMTYETGQPIVFVGTGQTYTDLKNLNVQAIVNALLS